MANRLRVLERRGAPCGVALSWCSGLHRLLALGLGPLAVAWLALVGPSLEPAVVRLLLLLGPVLAYGALAYLINETRLEARDGALRISWGPLPAGPTREIRREEIAHLHVRRVRDVVRRERTPRIDRGMGWAGGPARDIEEIPYLRYELRLHRADGGDEVLLGHLGTEEQATRAARALEQALGLPARESLGELGPG